MDQEAFTSFITRNKAALADQEADPMTAFSDSINVALYNRHPRALSMKADMLDKIDYNKVMELYKNRFADASDFTFILAGNVDAKQLLRLSNSIWVHCQLPSETKNSAIQVWLSAKDTSKITS